MTEPNEATTPLSRMRFSWQRGSGRPGGPTATDDVEEKEPDIGVDGWAPGPPEPSERDSPEVEESADADEPTDADIPEDELSVGRQELSNGHGSSYADTAVTDRTHPGAAPPPEIEAPPAPGPRIDPVVGQTDRPAAPASSPRSRKPKSAAAGRKASERRGDFTVPPPGGRFSGGRGTHVGLRVALILTTCLLALGVVAYIAFSFGVATMRENKYRLSQDDITRYGLTDFPLEQAGRFAADYARICMTHSSTPGAAEQREAQLARFVSSTTDPTCGWNGEGVQTVTDASWTGSSEPIGLPGYAQHARTMVVRVLTSAGSRIVTVPVYVADLKQADGMRVIGDVGEMPQPRLAAPPQATAPAEVDSDLSDALVTGEFFRQFFDAWGSSNNAALQRFVTPDALPEARSGLGGTLSTPTIDEAMVFLPSGVDSDDASFQWRTGMVTQAWVWVIWKNPAVGKTATERRAYRLQLVKTTQAASPAQEWAVRDIRGGVPDLGGG